MNEIITAKVFGEELQRRPILEELALEDQRINEQNNKPWIIRIIAEMNLNNVMKNILLWILISTMINYGETAFTDNRDSVGLLKIIFDNRMESERYRNHERRKIIGHNRYQKILD